MSKEHAYAYEPPVAAHWDGDVLTLTIPRDPSSIHVQRAEGQPFKVYPAEAELGRETCRFDPDYRGFTWWDENDVEHYEEDSASDECWSASCTWCGFSMMVGDDGWFNGWDDIKVWTEEDGTEHHGYVLQPRFKFCPNCGREVVVE